jgi:hypothetical protein
MLNASFSRNVPGTGGYPTYYDPSQQHQAQIGQPRSPPRFPVQPPYPNIGDHTSAVTQRVDPTPFQPGTGYVDIKNRFFPSPQANSLATPDIGSVHYGFVNPGPGRTGVPGFPTAPSSAGASYGGSSYGGSSRGEPHGFEREYVSHKPD